VKLIKIFFVMLFLTFLNYSKGIDKKYQTNADCQACHLKISKDWEKSKHFHSHYTKNELYNNVLEYIVVKDILKIKEEIIVYCAKCHNPRIEKRAVSEIDKIGKLLDIDEQTLYKMINTAYMKNGINCIVCHNVMSIEQNNSRVGFDAVKFGPQGVMYGPFKGAKSPYHLTKQKDFFKKEPNKLCMVCHKSGTNRFGLKVYTTGEEYLEFKNSSDDEVQNCVECHMSGEKNGVASNYRGEGGMVNRMVRDHIFRGIGIIKNGKYLTLSKKLLGDEFSVKISNFIPHKFPTGYGLREVELQVKFYDKNKKIIESKNRYFSCLDWAWVKDWELFQFPPF